jgi:hypothetical protein
VHVLNLIVQEDTKDVHNSIKMIQNMVIQRDPPKD